MVCRPEWPPLAGRKEVSPSIQEGNAWPRVVMADLEEGEIEEGELPVTEPEVGQPSQIIPNCAAMVVCILNSS